MHTGQLTDCDLNDTALTRRHSRAVNKPATRNGPRAPVHSMALAMSEVYQYEPEPVCIGVDMGSPAGDRAGIGQWIKRQPGETGCPVPAATVVQVRYRDGETACDRAEYRLMIQGAWVVHDPQPDSVCPVPMDVEFEVRLRNGSIEDGGYTYYRDDCWWQLGLPSDRTPNDDDIVAWRLS